jgi:hypothetical protein
LAGLRLPTPRPAFAMALDPGLEQSKPCVPNAEGLPRGPSPAGLLYFSPQAFPILFAFK